MQHGRTHRHVDSIYESVRSALAEVGVASVARHDAVRVEQPPGKQRDAAPTVPDDGRRSLGRRSARSASIASRGSGTAPALRGNGDGGEEDTAGGGEGEAMGRDAGAGNAAGR